MYRGISGRPCYSATFTYKSAAGEIFLVGSIFNSDSASSEIPSHSMAAADFHLCASNKQPSSSFALAIFALGGRCVAISLVFLNDRPGDASKTGCVKCQEPVAQGEDVPST